MLARGRLWDFDGTANDDKNAITPAEESRMSYSRSILSEKDRERSSETFAGVLIDVVIDGVLQAHLIFRHPTNLRSSFQTDLFVPYRSEP